jgi:hypothetical protein
MKLTPMNNGVHFGVLLDVRDCIVGLPDVEGGVIVVGDVRALFAGLTRPPFVHVHDVEIFRRERPVV